LIYPNAAISTSIAQIVVNTQGRLLESGMADTVRQINEPAASGY
jgi:hypothetical protein